MSVFGFLQYCTANDAVGGRVGRTVDLVEEEVVTEHLFLNRHNNVGLNV
jgi:hypothetical protein